ncbi:hypothetical protein C8R44DRAFT_671165 [Mycena epipterygia]|nr:hypothetical protein C8R44DRAFT_671165 [Mycena epipterygia]
MSQVNQPEPTGAGQVFALIIGIDKYMATDAFTTLEGCVNDAKLFRDFLTTFCELRGLQPHIKFLVDEAATRATILSTFQSHFLANPAIPDNGKTPMIFFFAGHGSRIVATDNRLSADNMVETICPCDERTESGGEYVHGIPDYVLGWLLRNIARKKGDNITVILDSCHSGGIARDDGIPRNAKIPSRPVPLELDSHLCEDVSQTLQSWSRSSASYVLLAACCQGESARELAEGDSTVHGRFTKSLVSRLHAAPLGNITYIELLDGLSWAGQNPHCTGLYRRRLVFSSNDPASGPRSLLLKRLENLPHAVQSFKVSIGSLEGVLDRTEFSVCTDQDVDGSMSKLRLVVSTVRIHETILRPADDQPPVPEGARVVVTNWNNDAMILRVHLEPGFAYTTDLFPTYVVGPPKPRRFVEALPEQADIVLRSDNGAVVITRKTNTMKVDGVQDIHIPLHDNAFNLPNIVDGISHFNYFLERRNDVASLRVQSVALEMYRLLGDIPGRRIDDEFGNMVREEGSTYEARFVSNEDAKYGFQIRNNGGEDLFPYLFYFDPEDYTISSLYIHSNGVPPLNRRGGPIAIGMGGEPAFEFTLPKNQVASSGFLKLFVSTEALDLEWIKQDHPLDSDFKGVGRLKLRQEEMPSKWDALRVVLTMTRSDE